MPAAPMPRRPTASPQPRCREPKDACASDTSNCLLCEPGWLLTGDHKETTEPPPGMCTFVPPHGVHRRRSFVLPLLCFLSTRTRSFSRAPGRPAFPAPLTANSGQGQPP
ncbi:hypothetical protein ZWY2020_037750 [Hordeum vulgare]|nr:hypothetical protein ZWY2020_037750 [Hordeum vulgare]